jgi:hypothetical protein
MEKYKMFQTTNQSKSIKILIPLWEPR